jgi:spore coat protein A
MMRFVVGASASLPADAALSLPASFTAGIDPFLANIGANGTYTLNVPVNGMNPRRLTLNEYFDAYGRLTQFLGTDVPSGPGRFGRHYADEAATEMPVANTTEIWEVANLTADTHPIHFHLVNVQILNRQLFNAAGYTGGDFTPFLIGPPISPDATELGWKETVKMHPGQVIRLIMNFNIPPTRITGPGPSYTPVDLTSKGGTALGDPPPSPRTGGAEYVWHCHILEHEEHDMMRPLVVV